jgi:hypothetical protein
MDTRHGVRDRLTGEIVYRSRPGTYYETHQRAERWCKRHLGERGTIIELTGGTT